MKIKSLIYLITGIFIFTILTSCPSPLEPEKLALLKDLEAPRIVITSPADYSEYATVIELEGYIEDTSLANLPADSGLSVSYSIPGTSINGTVDVSLPDGSFSGIINVAALSGEKVIEFSTTDINGNSASASVNILKPEGGDISGFTVTPGNRQVTICWAPVSGAESYSIFESSYGETIEPGEITGTSYTWTGLENGEIYSFQLTAHLPVGIGEDAYSSTATTMPLSPFNLTPVIKNTEHKAITIEWPANDNIDRFIVERSGSHLGPWEIKRVLTQNVFTDEKVEYDTNYYYRITPSGFTEINSLCAGSSPTRFSGDDIIATLPLPGSITPFSLQIDDNYAYIANFRDGLAIADISDPYNPIIVSSYGVASTVEIRDIFVRDRIAYLAGYDDGLLLVDISDIDNPVLLSSCSTPGNALGVYVSGDYAYIADDSERISIVDISTPASVTDSSLISGCSTDGIADKVLVKNGYAYVAADGLEVIDVSNPPLVNDLSTKGSWSSLDGKISKDIYISGEYLYIVLQPPPPGIPPGPSSLHIIDISVPANVTNSSGVGSCEILGNAEGVTVSGNLAYVASYDADLQVIDVFNPAAPVLERTYATSGDPFDVKVSGYYAYIADRYGSGLVVLDLAKPGSPSIVSASADMYRTSDIEIFDEYAYIADGTDGLKIMDISEPEEISPASNIIEFSLPGECLEINIRYPYAFIAAQGSGLVVVNIADPLHPSLLSSTETTQNAKDLYVLGNYAYVTDSGCSLEIIDITFPETPSIVSTCDTDGTVSGITVSGDYAYICAGGSGLQIIDISDPLSPYIAASCTSAGGARKAEIIGNYAVVSSNSAGLYIIDISDPSGVTNTSIVASHPVTGHGYSLAIAGDFVYVGGDERFTVVDITDPESPSTFSGCALPTLGIGYGIAVADSYAYIADINSGLQIINLLGGMIKSPP